MEMLKTWTREQISITFIPDDNGGVDGDILIRFLQSGHGIVPDTFYVPSKEIFDFVDFIRSTAQNKETNKIEDSTRSENKSDNKVPVVFISQAMSSVTEEEFIEQRNQCKMEVQRLLNERGEGKIMFDIIDNYTHPDAPKNANRLWHLGKSIQQIGNADYIYFSQDEKSKKARGCIVESLIAHLYKIPVLKEETEREKLLKRWLY